jgi:hypothetical protein
MKRLVALTVLLMVVVSAQPVHAVDSFYLLNAPAVTASLAVVSVSVPEPSTWALIVSGAVMLAMATWRRYRGADV